MIQSVTADVALKRRRTVNSLGTGTVHWSTDFLGVRSTEIIDEPQALLIEMNANETIVPHFHAVDQFQVFVAGSGTLGRADAAPITVQYVDHHTAYGPIVAGGHGLSYFALRRQIDSGPVYIDKPGYRDLLKPTPKRNRYTSPMGLSTEPVLSNRSEVVFEPLFDEKDGADGFAAFMLRMGPNMTTKGLDPKVARGLHYLVVNGSFELNGANYGPWSTIFVDPTEAAHELRSAAKGVEVVVMQFPREPS